MGSALVRNCEYLCRFVIPFCTVKLTKIINREIWADSDYVLCLYVDDHEMK